MSIDEEVSRRDQDFLKRAADQERVPGLGTVN